MKEYQFINKYLAFFTGGQLFGVCASNVLQIVRMQNITKLPGSPVFVKGLICLRGKIYPVIDMQQCIENTSKEYGDRACIIIIKIGEESFGFIVDELDEVHEISEEQILPSPWKGQDTRNDYLTGIGRLQISQGEGEKLIMLVNFKKLLRDKGCRT
jgi:purine-binding chemotaxis protein CheW